MSPSRRALVGFLLFPVLALAEPPSEPAMDANCQPAAAADANNNNNDVGSPDAKSKLNLVCQVQTGTTTPVFTPNLADPSALDVTNAVLAWLNDVCTVDAFLNNPDGQDPPLATVIAFGEDEPTHLKTLSSLPRLSQAGKNAAAVLEANFPSVPANLLNLQAGTASAYQVTTAINFDRCCTVLPAIAVLVKEAAAASGAFSDGNIPQPVFPNPCAKIDCASGASADAAK